MNEDMNTEGLAQNADELKQIQEAMVTPAGRAYAQAFLPHHDDVLIATYAKAGTTWMQQIVHGLRTGGDMSFQEISEVVPWIELAYDMGIKLESSQASTPRAFKTHYSYDLIPKGARYIWVIRNPADSALSMYNFLSAWMFNPEMLSLDDFIREFYSGASDRRSYWSHLLSWWPERHRDEVLAVSFEGMKSDLSKIVRQVAQFIGINVERNPDLLDTATRQAEFKFMKSHERQFDDHLIAQVRNGAMGLPADALSTKVRTGQSDSHRAVLSADSLAILDTCWRKTIGAELGFADYGDLRAALERDSVNK